MPLVRKRVIRLKDLEPLFLSDVGKELSGYRLWLTQTCHRVGFTPRVLQDVEIERTILQSVAAGLGIALLPDQMKKVSHEGVQFRPLNPAVKTESCIAWKADNPSAALKAYIEIVTAAGTSMR